MLLAPDLKCGQSLLLTSLDVFSYQLGGKFRIAIRHSADDVVMLVLKQIKLGATSYA
jgi:hypothetical protein